MGDPFVGLVHPCKIYNILSVACPVLYIGPQPSHLSEIFDALNGQYPCASARHGEVEKVLLHIQEIRRQVSPLDRRVAPALCGRFSKETLLPKLIAGLESKTAANAER